MNHHGPGGGAGVSDKRSGNAKGSNWFEQISRMCSRPHQTRQTSSLMSSADGRSISLSDPTMLQADGTGQSPFAIPPCYRRFFLVAGGPLHVVRAAPYAFYQRQIQSVGHQTSNLKPQPKPNDQPPPGSTTQPRHAGVLCKLYCTDRTDRTSDLVKPSLPSTVPPN